MHTDRDAVGADEAPPEPPRRRVRWKVIGTVVASVIVVAALVASLISVPYYAITPGSALDVSSLISIPPSAVHHHKGSVLLTDVELVPLRAIDYLFYRLNSDDDVVPTSEVTGPSTTTQYDEQGVIDMVAARQAATVVALRTVGYKVRAVANGVVDYQPEPDSPASALAVGDVLTSFDGAPTTSLAELVTAIDAHRPGQDVRLGYHFLSTTTTHYATVRLGEALATPVGSGDDETECLPAGSPKRGTPLVRSGHQVGCLGLYLEELFATKGAPFRVTIDAEGIIGPSAGLAFTLGLLQQLDADDLTGGARVAATGTMSIDGAVGDVGGVAQKTVAVRDAGATLFLVPPQELSVARAHAGTTLKVVAVSDIAQAIAALKAVGGRIALPPAS